MMPPTVFGPQTCGVLGAGGGDRREWLVTDGLGGYATGTVAGLRTRRHHALLAVADPATASRRIGLAALDLTLTLPSGAHVPLYTHEWRSGAVSPEGHRHLEAFALVDGLPRWRWRVGDIVVERDLALRHGHPSLAVVHRVLAAPGPVGLAVAAMCTWRDAHGERHATGPAPRVRHTSGGVVVEDAYRLAGPGWQPGGEWHLGAHCRADGATEDLWWAGTFVDRVETGGRSEISAWAGPLDERPPAPSAVIAAARERARTLVATAKVDDSAAGLVLAADAFVVRAADGPDVVAGYPWLGSRLGDTMTAYEGLFLETGRADEGRELLIARTQAACSPPSDHPAALTADGPLWLVHAVERHVARTGDTGLAAQLAGPLGRLLRGHLTGRGTLSVDPSDELLRHTGPARTGPAQAGPLQAGSAQASPTQAGPAQAGPAREGPAREGPAREGPGELPAARLGKPVEINALWINALGALAELLDQAGRDPGPVRARQARARESFAARFRAPEGWLYDVVDGPASAYPLGAGAFDDDPSLRPHQLLAWSLPHAPLAGPADRAAIRAVGGALLTPLGLRTLAPAEYGYQGREERDGPQHQGTVWPWLIGPYADACLAAGLPIDGLLTGLEAHLRDAGAGSISETAEGDPPHRPTGCPFSARSVAEALRIRRFAPCPGF